MASSPDDEVLEERRSWPVRHDILTSISGVVFEDAWPDHVTHETEGLSVPFLG